VAQLDVPCYHCGEPVPAGSDFGLLIGGERRPMCCPGCRAVAQLIADSGLAKFYEQRTAYNLRPEPDTAPDAGEYRVYDDPELARQFCDSDDDGQVSARLLIGGVTCAACTWLIERTLLQHPAVSAASMNLTQSRLDVRFHPETLPLSELMARIASLGYSVRPWHSSSQQAQARQEYRSDLRRLAVAGIGMMQVGMFAIALHAGDLQGISTEYRGLLRWVSLLVTGFVIGFAARGFFASAWRHLRAGALVMDLPVALAIGLAWLASAVATIWNVGDVYFDSVVMFTFLLLLARFLEKRVRYRDALDWQDAESLLPDAVMQLCDGQWCRRPRREVRAGDRLLLRAGETVPIDARVTSGASAVREDSFNGELLPRPVAPGATIYAGTLNLEAPLQVLATGSYGETRLAALQRSIDSARVHKPALARLADHIAGYFIGAVRLVTAVASSQCARGWRRHSSSGPSPAQPTSSVDALDSGPPSAAEVGFCGGVAGFSCEPGQYCDYPAGSCGAADREGNCRPRPEFCTQEFDPVCGCDDVSYPNACAAAAAGVSLRSEGPCAQPGQSP